MVDQDQGFAQSLVGARIVILLSRAKRQYPISSRSNIEGPVLRDDRALAERFMLPEISQILNPEWPSYPMACSIQPTTASVAVNHTGFVAPTCQSCPGHPLTNDSVPFPRSINLWLPNSNRQLFVRSRASATPHQWRWHTEPLDAFQDRCEQLPRRAPRLSLWPAFVVTDQRPASLRGGAFCDR